MARMLGRFILILLLVLPSTLLFAGNGDTFARAAEEAEDQEDAVEGEDAEDATTIENEGETTEPTDAPEPDTTGTVADSTEEEKEEDKGLKPSPDADTKLLFIKPTNNEYPAGVPVHLLIGFMNKGKKDFIVDNIDASFRYPQDFSYFIQNFSAVAYNTLVETNRERTFQYSFTPSDQFPARPFGLVINLNYRDNEGTQFIDAVFNDTVSIVELDEGLDGETFFLYIMMAAVVILILVGIQQFLASFSKKRLTQPKKPVVELGTQNSSGIDYDWIPAEIHNKKQQSPRASKSPKQSPRQRRTKRTTGSSDAE